MDNGKTPESLQRTPRYLTRNKNQGKRVKTCAETMAELGQNPFLNLARLAHLAEKTGDMATASANWRYLADFLDAKRKPIDPGEQEERGKRIMTLNEIQELKTLLQLPVIEQAPAVDLDDVQDLI